MSRLKSVVLITIGLFFSALLPYVVYALVALTAVTVAQRVLHIRKRRVPDDTRRVLIRTEGGDR